MPSYDAYSPAEVAKLVTDIGVKKANLPLLQTITLSILAGAFIAFGAMFFTVVITDSTLGYGPTRLLGGIAFSLGLILVVVAGAELFTGNNLIVIAWAQQKITTQNLLRNWSIVYLGNFVGAIASALMIVMSGTLNANHDTVANTAFEIAQAKASLSLLEALVRGILCNALVCLAVWLCVAAHTVAGKIMATLFPITAFVALGFEHSVANMYLMSVAVFHPAGNVTFLQLMMNLVPVTIGNIIGGSVFVALVYWVCYLRQQ